MTMTHVRKIGSQVVEIITESTVSVQVVTENGRKATYYKESHKLVFKHSVTGQYCSKQY